MNLSYCGAVRRIIIEFEKFERGQETGMTDWIDDLKKRDDDNEHSAAQRKEWELRCDDMISSRGPILLEQIIAQVKVDVVRLTEAFPNDDSKHIQIAEEQPLSIRLTRPTFPYVEFSLSWYPRERLIGIRIEKQDHRRGATGQTRAHGDTL